MDRNGCEEASGKVGGKMNKFFVNCALVSVLMGTSSIAHSDSSKDHELRITRDWYGDGYIVKKKNGGTLYRLQRDWYGDGYIVKDRLGRTVKSFEIYGNSKTESLE